jgi:hypothetical protein
VATILDKATGFIEFDGQSEPNNFDPVLITEKPVFPEAGEYLTGARLAYPCEDKYVNGDRVIVEMQPADNGVPRVIGFHNNPKQCQAPPPPPPQPRMISGLCSVILTAGSEIDLPWYETGTGDVPFIRAKTYTQFCIQFKRLRNIDWFWNGFTCSESPFVISEAMDYPNGGRIYPSGADACINLVRGMRRWTSEIQVDQYGWGTPMPADPGLVLDGSVGDQALSFVFVPVVALEGIVITAKEIATGRNINFRSSNLISGEGTLLNFYCYFVEII